MSTTQYIGARYVPLFANPIEWNSTRTYEPLTIVVHEGNSYTSKQYVPFGIGIDNDDYWAVTGNYNAQVEQYRRDVKECNEKVEAVDTKAQNALDLADNALDLADTNKKNIAILNAQMAGTQDSGLKSLIEKKRSIDIWQIANPTGPTYTCSIVITDKVGLIDCGVGMADSVVAFMIEHGYDSFDYVVFTHMHADHIDHTKANIDKLKPYINSTTPIYIQMAPESSFAQYEKYTAGYASACELGNPTVPIDKASVKFGNTTLTFYNTCCCNIERYSEYSELNIFSLVCRVDYEGSSYVDCGDIYWTAQNKYQEKIGNCDMFKWPHHGVNAWDSYGFISQFAAKAFTASPDADGNTLNTRSGNAYVSKWARQILNPNGYYQNLNENTRFTISNGSVTSEHAIQFRPKRAASFLGSLDVDANTGNDIDAYKTWTLSEFMYKMSRLPFGSSFCIAPMINYDGVQFAMQLYSLMLGMHDTPVPGSKSFNAIVCKKVIYHSTVEFRFTFTNYCPFEMSMIPEYENTIGALPTFTSYEDVRNRYAPADIKTTQVKTVIGELFDAKGNVSGLPCMVHNDMRAPAKFGSYVLGKQTLTDFVKMDYAKSGWLNCEPKTMLLMFNATIGSFTAGTTTSIMFTSGHDNFTCSIVKSAYVYNFMLNETHFQIFQNNVLLYDSANDTDEKVSILARL